MDYIEKLRVAVSAMDESLKNLVSEDDELRENAILDAAWLLSAAKNVVLNA